MRVDSEPGASPRSPEWFPPRPTYNHSRLVVVLHAWNQPVERLAGLCQVIRNYLPDSDIDLPALGLGIGSCQDLVELSRQLADRIDKHWWERTKRSGDGHGYDDIILVGHSVGATLARTIYLVALGVDLNSDHCPTKDSMRWTEKLTRIIQFAAFNRGWEVSYLSQRFRALGFAAGRVVATTLRSLIGVHIGLQLYRGSVFINQMRLHWLKRERQGKDWPLVIQLLGSRDDLISPEVAVDLVTAQNFAFLDVPFSDHYTVVDLVPGDDATPRQREVISKRSEIFIRALTEDADKLRASSELRGPEPPDESIKHVVFVIHGIRDPGYWAQHIARTVLDRAERVRARSEIKVLSPSYGYFGMGPFLLRRNRLSKVTWFMEQYLLARALFPNAEISYIGHSNGTYLPTCALEKYPSCRFLRLALAGSVVRSGFPWPEYMPRGSASVQRVDKVCNYVATDDLVVAGFPNLFEAIEVADLGAAGHRGFTKVSDGRVINFRFVPGGHGAALAEEFWESLGDFIVTGDLPQAVEQLREQKQSWLARLFGSIPLIAWLIAVVLAVILGGLFVGLAYLLGSIMPEWRSYFVGASVVAYIWMLRAILRRV